jgi:iron complex outermembrane recepter protein
LCAREPLSAERSLRVAIRPEITPQNLIRLNPAEESEMLTSLALACLIARADDSVTDDAPEEEGDDRSPELIVVTGVRADTTTPVTKTELSRDDLDALYHGQEVPYVLANTPGVMAWGDTGTGAGYSYFSLRGIHQTRLDITLNGVPLADMEDMGVYLSNLVDFTSSMESVQVQRGVGTAAGGTPSFGGAVHFESIGLDEEPGGELNFGLGSFGTSRASVAAQTGALGRWRAAFRTSGFRNEGFRDHSDISQGSAFASVGRFGDESTLRITGLVGRERQHLSWYAADAATLALDPAANPMGPDARDEFGQDVLQVQYAHDMGEDDEISGSVYWNGGRGWYAQNANAADPTSPMQTYTLDGATVGAFGSYVARVPHWTVTPGVHVNAFRRTHQRFTIVLKDYENIGTKTELSGFVKAAGEYGRWHPYADVQVRRAALSYVGSGEFGPRSWTFVNPKVGIGYAPSEAISAYASFGASGREPTRSDMFGGDDYDPSLFTDIVPERVLDVELGVNGRSERVTWAVDVYSMELFNEIAWTGELLPTGLLRRVNVDRSWRRGLEADVTVRPTDVVTLQAIGSLSMNGIAEWTQEYTVIEPYYYYGVASETFRDVPVLQAPWGIGQLRATVAPVEPLSASVGVRGVSEQYLDNTGDEDFVCPAFALVALDLAWQIDHGAARTTIAFHVENATNSTAYPSGYSWRFEDGDPAGLIDGVSYYFPHTPRSALVNITSKF